MNDPPSNQRVAQAQPQLVHSHAAPQPQLESQLHVAVHEQVDVQAQLVLAVVAFASSVVVFMRHLVFGLTGL